MTSACLIEIGTEELPPRALQALARDFGDRLRIPNIALHEPSTPVAVASFQPGEIRPTSRS